MDGGKKSGDTAAVHSSLSAFMQKHLDSAVRKPDSFITTSPKSQYLENHISKSPSDNLNFSRAAGSFVIPNFSNILKGSKNGGLENLVSKLQIQSSPIKIPASRDVEIQRRLADRCQLSQSVESTEDCDNDADNWEIDLSDAIIKTAIISKEETAMEEPPKERRAEEVLSLELVKCDVEELPMLDNRPLLPCLLYNTEGSGLRRSRRAPGKVSAMGRVMCMRPRGPGVPRIHWKYYDPLQTVHLFKFDCPCPDQVILNNLKMKKGCFNKRTFLEP